MSWMEWDKTAEKLYENGIKKTVLFPYSTQNGYKPGVPWNGVTGITEQPGGAEETSLYADDDKYISLRSKETLGFTIEAFMSPEEFDECDGTKSPIAGVRVGQQSRRMFGLAYRTIIGNDTELDDHGYKLHLVYGATAAPTERGYSTLNESPDVSPLSWQATTVPVEVGEGYRKTSIITIDSTKVDATKLKALEDIIYDAENAYLPLPSEVISIFNGDGPAPEPTYTYNAVTPVGTENPSEEGWYESSGFGGYTLTTDTEVDSEKTYYERVSA